MPPNNRNNQRNSTVQKPELTRESLSRNRIHYHEKLHGFGDLPDHVEDLRGILLDFGCPIFKKWKSNFDQNYDNFLCRMSEAAHREVLDSCSLKPADSHFWNHEYAIYAQSRRGRKREQGCREDVLGSLDTARRFESMGRDRESAWVHSLVTDLFKRFDVRNGGDS